MTRRHADFSRPHRHCTVGDVLAIVIAAGVAVIFLACVFMLIVNAVKPAHARDLGQWEHQDPATSAWYRSLMQPDNPTVPCCGEADAYYADIVNTDKDGNLVAVITDDRPDEPLGRPHVQIGTKVVVPASKIKWDRGNPTGHIILFLGYSGQVYCFVQNGGV